MKQLVGGHERLGVVLVAAPAARLSPLGWPANLASRGVGRFADYDLRRRRKAVRRDRKITRSGATNNAPCVVKS